MKRDLEGRIVVLALEKKVAVLEKRVAALEYEKRLEEDEKEPLRPFFSRKKRRRLPWLKAQTNVVLPEAIIGHITSFLRDNDLFKLRTVNLVFYAAYFNQRITLRPIQDGREWGTQQPFNAHRAIALAAMGRVFPKVEAVLVELDDDDPEAFYAGGPQMWDSNPEISEKQLAAISPRSFPKLQCLGLWNLKLVKHVGGTRLFANFLITPGHQTLTRLGIIFREVESNYGPAGLRSLDRLERFPSLETLQVVIPEEHNDLQLSFAPHRNLQRLILRARKGAEVDWTTVSKQRFPRLAFVRLARMSREVDVAEVFPMVERMRLLYEGVEIAVV